MSTECIEFYAAATQAIQRHGKKVEKEESDQEGNT